MTRTVVSSSHYMHLPPVFDCLLGCKLVLITEKNIPLSLLIIHSSCPSLLDTMTSLSAESCSPSLRHPLLKEEPSMVACLNSSRHLQNHEVRSCTRPPSCNAGRARATPWGLSPRLVQPFWHWRRFDHPGGQPHPSRSDFQDFESIRFCYLVDRIRRQVK